MQIAISLDQKALTRVLVKLKRLQPSEQAETFRNAWRQATAFVAQTMIRSASGRILKRRTGQLSKIQFVIDRKRITSIIGNRVVSGNPVPYTAIHEYGGTIKPRNGKYLAIPIGKALTRSGVARFRPREIEQNGYDDSAVFRSKKGNLIIWGIKHLKTKDKLVPLFALKKSVNIPARHWVSKSAKLAAPGVIRTLENWINSEVKK